MYKICYMSCNLDHVLYNKLNTSDKEKEIDALNFADNYERNISGFCDFMKKSSFSKCISYKDSWEFIKSNNNSIKRFSNLGICF